jgi:hypothetical protein
VLGVQRLLCSEHREGVAIAGCVRKQLAQRELERSTPQTLALRVVVLDAQIVIALVGDVADVAEHQQLARIGEQAAPRVDVAQCEAFAAVGLEHFHGLRSVVIVHEEGAIGDGIDAAQEAAVTRDHRGDGHRRLGLRLGLRFGFGFGFRFRLRLTAGAALRWLGR